MKIAEFKVWHGILWNCTVLRSPVRNVQTPVIGPFSCCARLFWSIICLNNRVLGTVLPGLNRLDLSNIFKLCCWSLSKAGFTPYVHLLRPVAARQVCRQRPTHVYFGVWHSFGRHETWIKTAQSVHDIDKSCSYQPSEVAPTRPSLCFSFRNRAQPGHHVYVLPVSIIRCACKA